MSSKISSKNWPTEKLGEVISIIESGKRPKGGATSVGIPSLGVENITGQNSFRLGNLKYIPENFYKSLTKGKINIGDILIAKDGATTGKIAYVSDNFPFTKSAINEHIFILRGKEHLIVQKFLFYFLFSPTGQYQILKTKHGAAQGGIDQSFVNFVKITLPSIKVQHQIVERLDVIRKAQELNDKQIALADELFQSLLHRELDPKGKNWELKKIGEISQVNPRTNLDLNKDNIKYVEMAAIDEKLKEIRYFLERPMDKISSGAPRFRDNDVIFARITPCTENGKIALVKNCHEVCAGSTEFHVLRAKQNKLSPHFLFYCLISSKVRNMAVASMSGSTGRQRVPAEFFHYLKISLPPLQTQREIVRKLQAVQDYKKKLIDQKQKLQELFDCCLNKMMNGEYV